MKITCDGKQLDVTVFEATKNTRVIVDLTELGDDEELIPKDTAKLLMDFFKPAEVIFIVNAKIDLKKISELEETKDIEENIHTFGGCRCQIQEVE